MVGGCGVTSDGDGRDDGQATRWRKRFWMKHAGELRAITGDADTNRMYFVAACGGVWRASHHCGGEDDRQVTSDLESICT